MVYGDLVLCRGKQARILTEPNTFMTQFAKSVKDQNGPLQPWGILQHTEAYQNLHTIRFYKYNSFITFGSTSSQGLHDAW